MGKLITTLISKDFFPPIVMGPFEWPYRWVTGVISTIFLDLFVFLPTFYGLYHGKSTFCTTIWENSLNISSKHQTSKSKYLMMQACFVIEWKIKLVYCSKSKFLQNKDRNLDRNYKKQKILYLK